jgi:hypothetical protein
VNLQQPDLCPVELQTLYQCPGSPAAVQVNVRENQMYKYVLPRLLSFLEQNCTGIHFVLIIVEGTCVLMYVIVPNM